MRFAITAIDQYEDIFHALLKAGWEPVKLFTFPLWNQTRYESNRSVIERAAALKIRIQMSRMTDDDLQDLARRRCDVLIGAGYYWRIGDWRPYLPYAVNFHPSPLPEARGPYPLHQALLEGRREWGVSCHKFAPEFDSGDILAQRRFPLDPNECHDSLTMKVQLNNRRLATDLADNLAGWWAEATPQEGGSYWGQHLDKDSVLDCTEPVDTLLRKIRAFGLIGTVIVIDGQRHLVTRAIGWNEAHDHPPGTVMRASRQNIVVAVADGYLGVL